MRSMVYSNTSKPKRPMCPQCGKKGIGVWHQLDLFRDRNCRYCGYTEMQDYVLDRINYNGQWQYDVERMASYNGLDAETVTAYISALQYS